MYIKCTLTCKYYARKYVCPELAPALSLECFQTFMLYSVSDFDKGFCKQVLPSNSSLLPVSCMMKYMITRCICD